jgi:hypothetical protein
MKRLLIVGVVLSCSLLFTGAAFAGQADNNCGCGLGNLLWEDKADDSIVSQTLQVTTNGISANMLFGITSGTSECERPANIAASERLMEFASRNMDSLAKDISKGEGESLDTLAELMEIPVLDHNHFSATLQNNFGSIFVNGEESAATILDRIALVIN